MLAVLAAALAFQPVSACDEPVHAAFDFWVGEWNVYDASGGYQGHNRITRTDGGCVVREEWASASGGTGFSLNFVDLQAGQWRQIWVSRQFQIDYSGGLDAAGAMTLLGEIRYAGQAGGMPFRGVWTPLEDGRVRQHFEQQDPATGQWSAWFTGWYVRVEDDPNAEAVSEP